MSYRGMTYEFTLKGQDVEILGEMPDITEFRDVMAVVAFAGFAPRHCQFDVEPHCTAVCCRSDDGVIAPRLVPFSAFAKRPATTRRVLRRGCAIARSGRPGTGVAHGRSKRSPRALLRAAQPAELNNACSL